MQPLGRKKKHYNFEDGHLGPGFENWWESGVDTSENKKQHRQMTRREINRLFDEYYEELKYNEGN